MKFLRLRKAGYKTSNKTKREKPIIVTTVTANNKFFSKIRIKCVVVIFSGMLLICFLILIIVIAGIVMNIKNANIPNIENMLPIGYEVNIKI